MSIELIRELSSKILATSDAKPMTLYLLDAIDRQPPADSVARMGGKPIGIKTASWPSFDGRPMEHLITVDLDAMPTLKTGALADARAFALFISDRMGNEAFVPGTKEAAVVALSQQDIDQGEPAINLRDSGKAATCYEVVPVEVPATVFDDAPDGDDEDDPLPRLRNTIYSSPAYAAGKPLWLQFEEHEGHFLLQFDESFIDVNLGDAGIMYVFSDTAFWQCH